MFDVLPEAKLQMSRPSGALPWVVWGGVLPSGSIKYLTFRQYLNALTPAGCQHGLVEASDGCTALALDHWARQLGVPCLIVTSHHGSERLRARGFRGQIQVVDGVLEALDACRSKQSEGWHWPRQMSNSQLVAAVEAWAPEVASLLAAQPLIDTVATGFGTGATLVGLHAKLAPLGYRVVGLQPGAGASVPGWRNYASQNLGSEDLFHDHSATTELRTAEMAALPSTRSALDVLLAQTWGVDPARVCVIAHDGVPPTTDSVIAKRST
jgi:cysteine synthase B